MSTRATLKSFFETGDKPTQSQFYDLIDSLFHKTEDSVNWTEVAGKPTSFAPSAHTHAWADLTGVPTTFAPSAHTHSWADITGKPTTFAPSAHVHSAGEITTGLFHPSRIGAGTTTDGYIIQLVAGVPTWVVAPSGGGSTPPAGSTGQVQYNGGGVFAGSSFFFWDNTNSRLGIGTSSPSYSLDVNGTARLSTVPTISTATKMLVKDPTTGQISEQLLPSGGGWGLSGNAGITTGVNFVGTSDPARFDIRANSIILGQFYSGGNVVFNDASTSSGTNNFVSGYGSSASSTLGTAIGVFAQANNVGVVAIGNQSRANHPYSFVIANKGGAGTYYSSVKDDGMIFGAHAGFDWQVSPGVNEMSLNAASGLYVNSVFRPRSYTVASLPSGMPAGSLAIVTDALTPTYRTNVSGGGSERCLVMFNGTQWICH